MRITTKLYIALSCTLISSASSQAFIPGFKGSILLQGTVEYNNSRVQYATSSLGDLTEHDLWPLAIVKPQDKDDIMKVFLHANETGCTVAIRTGGHQYLGASSTNSTGIQLDLSETFKGEVQVSSDNSLVQISVSWGIGELVSYLASRGMFVPTGQCVKVMLGGHVQTGGYGMFARSFGLLSDTVEAINMIAHDGRDLYVSRTSYPELFWPTMGGSPGNFGVVTHITFRPLLDSNHQGARGLKAIFAFSRANLKRLLDFVVEIAETPEFPRNYDLSINSLDINWSTAGHGVNVTPSELKTKELDTIPVIIVYAQWIPIFSNETFGPEQKAWFDRLLDGHLTVPLPGFNQIVEKPVSQLTDMWLFKKSREFDNPYIKHTYLTNSTTLSTDGFSYWAAGRFDEIVGLKSKGLQFVSQIQPYGGTNSQYHVLRDLGTSHSWRHDATVLATFDVFHDDNEEAKREAEEWTRKNYEQGIGPQGKFSKEDRRVFWGPYGDWNMDNVWQMYFDSENKYKTMGQARTVWDPNGVFTPNPFAVRAIELIEDWDDEGLI